MKTTRQSRLSLLNSGFWLVSFVFFILSPMAIAQTSDAERLDLDPEVIENSPVLQRWLEEVPDVLDDIRNDPSFKTRVRLGYSQFSDADDSSGVQIGVEDIFLGRTGLTLSGDYQASGGDRSGGGAELRYYLLPLGNYVNIAPVLGYRQLESEDYSIDGVQLGGRVMLALSRTGAADIALGYSRVGVGSEESGGLFSINVGYAVLPQLRLGADWQRQDAEDEGENRWGIVLEWLP
jgi:hypothetical protein